MRRHTSNLTSALFLLFLSASSAFADQEETCSEGCPVSTDSQVVCASDGRTYSSECLARCQGVQVVATGRCLGRPGLLLKESGDAVLTSEDMGRYADQGFRLLGHANVREFDPEESAKKALLASRTPPASKLAAAQLLAAVKALEASGPDALAHAVMYTSDGLVYAAAPQARRAASSAASNASTPIDAGNVTAVLAVPPRTAHRKLASIFGIDDRRQITFSAAYPYSAVGQLTLNSRDGSSRTCTAFMISRRAILTAAHCVFDRATNSWQRNFVFHPARYSGNRYPYGSVGWTNVYTFSGYTNPSTGNPWPFDLAVIRLSNAVLGDRTGWFGLSTYSTLRTTLNTAGYPGDKPSGTYWWTSCYVDDTNGGDGDIVHYCDVYPGQSGSPMWTSDNYVRGVMSYRMVDNTGRPLFNGAAEITPARIGSILDWR